MLKKTLFFTNPYRLSLKNNQLVAESHIDGEIRTIPVEDIGFVILDNMQISISLPLIEALVENNVAIVFSNSKHLPQAMMLNLDSHSLQTEIFRTQINASLSIKKNLWKQTIESKIKNQAKLLELLGKDNLDILNLSKNVKSGDSDNREGIAARIYWSRLFHQGFIRDRYGIPPNNLLNYGYIVLRAAVARALVGSGLLPTLGIHHHNRYNAYCLADDIMEPYRPYVDKRVYSMYQSFEDVFILEKEHKAELLKVLTDDVKIDGLKRPLSLALSITTASLSKVFAGEIRNLKYPILE
ncbi:MAG: type II CRISPR-associated endonuclease Cas1 [Bacteroidales bacterium]|jgi:CRISPR-associated protein Cas1|nr:type II CRISPR-associated endonuclease Cas1 [Bacteroidales bacterium]MDY0315541.1 type II CRISPR-associated endonuclease Cas1 [Bacteroidales bacterium]NLB87189.1 type II CRISPR-associated endonuclease Cas1 [Bacteroidales bacterium]